MCESRPVVERPTSETQWTCPAAPGEGMTHHMVFPANRCQYCAKDAAVLRAEQAEALPGVVAGASAYDLGWAAGFRGTTPPDGASAEYVRGYFAGYGDLLADEKRAEQSS